MQFTYKTFYKKIFYIYKIFYAKQTFLERKDELPLVYHVINTLWST